jgi:hypothetical protein
VSATAPTQDDLKSFLGQGLQEAAVKAKNQAAVMEKIDREIEGDGINQYLHYLRNTTVKARDDKGEPVRVEVSTIFASLTPTMIAEHEKSGTDIPALLCQTIVEVVNVGDRTHFTDPLTKRYDSPGTDREMDARHQELVDALRNLIRGN